MSWEAISNEFALISQGRDGKIRFWYLDAILRAGGGGDAPLGRYACYSQFNILVPIHEISCCACTFCPFATWKTTDDLVLLAYVSGHNDIGIEVIRSTDGLIVASVDTSPSTGIAARLGMCMALAGLSCAASCQFVAGFEGACVVLFVQGREVSRVELGQPPDLRPITCLAAHHFKDGHVIIAVGMATLGEGRPVGNQSSDLAFLHVETNG